MSISTEAIQEYISKYNDIIDYYLRRGYTHAVMNKHYDLLIDISGKYPDMSDKACIFLILKNRLFSFTHVPYQLVNDLDTFCICLGLNINIDVPVLNDVTDQPQGYKSHGLN